MSSLSLPLKTAQSPTPLQTMLDDLSECKTSPDYDTNYQQPTSYAVTRTQNLLQDSSAILGNDLPLGTLLPDGNGGIRIEWIRSVRELSVMVPAKADGKEYLYHEEDTDYKVEHNLTPHSLAQWLRWLESDTPKEK